MTNLLVTLFGASWRTTLLGFAEAIGMAILTYLAAGIPDLSDSQKQQIFIGGLLTAIVTAIRGYFTKDASVSNAPHPLAVAQPIVPLPAPPAQPKPIMAQPAAPVATLDVVIPAPPFSITGLATWFGLNPDGSDDKGDVSPTGADLKGAFGDETHNKTLIGISIPIPIFHATLGTGMAVYKEVANRRWLFDVYCPSTKKHVGGVWLVDLGPNESLNRPADMTYGLATALGLKDNAIVTWWVTDTTTGNILEIKGFNFATGKVG